MTPYCFSNEQRKRLRDEGVIDQQITALERVLPLCRSLWENAAPLSVVRAELNQLAKALHGARTLLTEWENSHKEPNRKPQREAYTRLLNALTDTGVDTNKVQGLHQLTDAIDRALADLSKSERRPFSASPRPVQLLDEALRAGWNTQHPPITTRYPHAPSGGLTSRFRIIVGVCYEAFTGRSDIDPERAIKAYVRQRKRCEPLRKIKMTLGNS